ncbi:MAG TPA: T9SS type A sorting domain-containing protein, partial [Bacteroidia bacterium]|nr:T9SS type A sorting domain-containing protein [Bacteroidia bacterium]
MADAAGLDRQINTFDTNGVMTNSVTFFGNNNYNVSGSSVPLVLHVENDDEIYIVSQTGGTSGMWYISSLTTTPAPTISQNFTSLSANYNLTGTTYQWYLNGNIINGATDSTYTFTQNGVYSVTVTIASGCDYSYSYTVTNTGIANAANLNNIKVSPNPFNDYINISNTTGQLTTLTLFDAAGRTVILETTHEPDYKKQLQQLPKGMYFLTIESGSQSKHIKLLKH